MEKFLNLHFTICPIGKLNLVIESITLQYLLFRLKDRFFQFYDLWYSLAHTTSKPLVDLANN